MLAGGKVRKFSKCSLTFIFSAYSCTICPCYLAMEFYAMQCRDPMNNNKDCRVGQLTNRISALWAVQDIVIQPEGPAR